MDGSAGASAAATVQQGDQRVRRCARVCTNQNPRQTAIDDLGFCACCTSVVRPKAEVAACGGNKTIARTGQIRYAAVSENAPLRKKA